MRIRQDQSCIDDKSPMRSLTTDHGKRFGAGAAHCARGVAVSSIACEKQAMEMTEYRKHENDMKAASHPSNTLWKAL
jgi:hypothetical protein